MRCAVALALRVAVEDTVWLIDGLWDRVCDTVLPRDGVELTVLDRDCVCEGVRLRVWLAEDVREAVSVGEGDRVGNVGVPDLLDVREGVLLASECDFGLKSGLHVCFRA